MRALTPLSRSIFFLFVALVLLTAQPIDANPVQLELTDNVSRVAVGQYLEYWVDAEGSAGIQTVSKLADASWKTSDQEIPVLGFSDNAHWFRFSSANTTTTPLNFLLSSHYTSIDNLTYFVFDGNQLTDTYVTGDQLPFNSRRVYNRNFILPVEYPPHQSKHIYIRVQTEGIVQLPLVLRSYENQTRFEQHFLMAQGLYFGMVIIMVLYNLILCASVRDSTYLLFVLGIGAYAIYEASIQGFAFQYLWPQYPELNQKAVIYGMTLYGFSGCFFAISFLRLKPPHAFYYLCLGFGIFFLILFLMTLLNLTPYHFNVRSAVFGSILGGMIVFLIGLCLLLKGHKVARFFVLGYGSVLALVITQALSKTGLIQTNLFTEYAPQVGSLFQILLLSFALADRINLDRVARIKALQKAHRNEQLAQQEQILATRKSIQSEAENKAKGEFIAVMSHEIRTPMNGVLGMVELMKGTHLEKQQREYLDVIASSGTALVTIINDILDYSKIDAKKLEIEMSEFELAPLVEDCIRLSSATIHNRPVKVSFEIDPETPGTIRSDAVRLRQILLNILNNAIKFTEEGSVRLVVHPVPPVSDSKSICFEVSDTGIGFSEEQKRRLFSAFSQADKSITRKFGGTGLGLSISKSLIELLGGKIDVHSVQGKGSTFWFTIRNENSEPGLAQSPEPPIPDGKDWATTLQTVNNRKILIVEDNPVNQMVVEGLLKHLGLTFDTASDGQQGIDLYMKNHCEYCMILMDCEMPKLDGYAATRTIRIHESDNNLPRTPIVALTAQALREHQDQVHAAGMDFHLTKPIDVAAFNDTIRSILSKAAD